MPIHSSALASHRSASAMNEHPATATTRGQARRDRQVRRALTAIDANIATASSATCCRFVVAAPPPNVTRTLAYVPTQTGHTAQARTGASVSHSEPPRPAAGRRTAPCWWPQGHGPWSCESRGAAGGNGTRYSRPNELDEASTLCNAVAFRSVDALRDTHILVERGRTPRSRSGSAFVVIRMAATMDGAPHVRLRHIGNRLVDRPLARRLARPKQGDDRLDGGGILVRRTGAP